MEMIIKLLFLKTKLFCVYQNKTLQGKFICLVLLFYKFVTKLMTDKLTIKS